MLEPRSISLAESVNIADEARKAWANKIAAETDKIIREGLNRKIGEGWTLADLAGRCQSVRFHGAAFETLYVDGRPFLELHDLEFPNPPPAKPGDPMTLNATRNYRFL